MGFYSQGSQKGTINETKILLSKNPSFLRLIDESVERLFLRGGGLLLGICLPALPALITVLKWIFRECAQIE
jgi:hypothetical protein